MAHNARRLCEVFCISQNLQMYEVPERASDGKASGRCSGSPKGFRYIVSGLGEVAEIEAQMFSFAQKFNRRTELEFSTKPAILPNPCYAFALFWSSSYKFSVIKSLQYALICCLTFLNSSAISSSVPVALAGSGKL